MMMMMMMLMMNLFFCAGTVSEKSSTAGSKDRKDWEGTGAQRTGACRAGPGPCEDACSQLLAAHGVPGVVRVSGWCRGVVVIGDWTKRPVYIYSLIVTWIYSYVPTRLFWVLLPRHRHTASVIAKPDDNAT